MFFERKRMLKKEAAGWEGPAAENQHYRDDDDDDKPVWPHLGCERPLQGREKYSHNSCMLLYYGVFMM